MKYIYGICVLLVLAVGIGTSVYFAKQPQSATVIPYATMNTLDEMPSLVASKMRAALKSAPVVILGVTPGELPDLQFWSLFLQELRKSPEFYSVILIDPKLPRAKEVFPEAVSMDLKTEIDRFNEGVENAKAQGLRMAVIAPTMYVSQVIEENPVSRWIRNTQTHPLSLTLTAFPRAANEEENMDLPCRVGDKDREGTGALGCVIQKRARTLYRKNPTPGKFEGLVDQMGPKDFLIYWNHPKQ